MRTTGPVWPSARSGLGGAQPGQGRADDGDGGAGVEGHGRTNPSAGSEILRSPGHDPNIVIHWSGVRSRKT